MSKVVVITDSTAGLPPEIVKQYNIIQVAQILIWGDETFYDTETIQPDEFYRKLAKATVMPASSQVTPSTLEKIYREQLGQGNDVLMVVVSSKLSGTLNSATQARDAIGGDRVAIVDSFLTAMAMGFAVMAAARLAAQGANLADCKEAAEQACLRAGVLVAVDTLEFLHRGGRIGGASRFLGTALNIKPILELQHGRLEPLERVRTRTKAIARLVDLLDERTAGKTFRVAVLHANAEEDAVKLMETVTSRFKTLEQVIAPVSPVVGTHVGPGTLGLAWLVEG